MCSKAMNEILKQRIQLSDGSFDSIITRSLKADHFNCMLCRVGDLPGERNLQIHILGRKHKHKLTTTPDAAKYGKSLDLVEMGK